MVEHRSKLASTRPRRNPRTKVAKGARSRDLHVAMASSEIGPFAKTGGLADMVASLSGALERLGLKVTLVMPAYRCAIQGDFHLEETGMRFTVPVSDQKEDAVVFKTAAGQNVDVYLVRADRYFDRDSLYTSPEGDHPDNAERFVFFARAVLEILEIDPPQILHCHDWQSALTIVFLKNQPQRYPELSSAKSVLTVHNLGYQGLFWGLDWHLLDLDPSLFDPRHLEFHGKINFLKGGLVFADAITTVSPTYAEEVKTPGLGFGLDGVLRERASDLTGILNGTDYGLWNPEADRLIARNYGPKDLSGKQVCKAALQRVLRFAEKPEVPLLGMVSRLTPQKGIDLFEKALHELLRRELQLVLLGSGERRYEQLFIEAASRYPGKVAVRIGFDEPLAHQIEAGCDIFLMPSLYEPCGLNQLYSMKYGTIPVVSSTGGLKDTVIDYKSKERAGNGFVFEQYEPSALLEAVDRALNLFRRKRRWAALMKRAMAGDFSWDRSALAYYDLYRDLLA